MRWPPSWRRQPEEVRRAPSFPPGARPSVGPDVRRYSISCELGGFGLIGIPWTGTSYEDARDTFMAYLYDDAEYNDTGGHYPNFRSLYVRFNGQHRLLTFRTDWITGFTVS